MEIITEIQGHLSQMSLNNLMSNTIFVGLMGVALVGLISMAVRRLSTISYGLLRKLLFDDVVMYSESPTMYYFERWLYENKDISKRRNVIINQGSRPKGGELGREVTQRGFDSIIDAIGCEESEESGSDLYFYYTLGNGIHLFIIKGRLFLINKSSEITKTGKKIEQITCKVFGYRGKEVISKCINQCRNQERTTNVLKVYPSAAHGFYSPIQTTKRNLNTVYCPGNLVKDLINDIDNFMENKEWYAKRGIPYRRGYLLYGKPGTGKSSLIKSIVSKYSESLFMINLPSISDDSALSGTFSEAVNRAGKFSFIVLEDIDCVSASEKRDGEHSTTGRENTEVTLQGLLNVLDGVASNENVIVFMTTNHKDVLDPALIRPGRADVHLHLDYFDVPTTQRYLKDYYEIKEVGHKLPTGLRISGAELQNICMTSPTVQHAVSKIRIKGVDNATVPHIN